MYRVRPNVGGNSSQPAEMTVYDLGPRSLFVILLIFSTLDLISQETITQVFMFWV